MALGKSLTTFETLYIIANRLQRCHKGGFNARKFVDAEQVAHYLKVDKFTVYRLATQKRFQHSRLEPSGDLKETWLMLG